MKGQGDKVNDRLYAAIRSRLCEVSVCLAEKTPPEHETGYNHQQHAQREFTPVFVEEFKHVHCVIDHIVMIIATIVNVVPQT